jgi:UDP-N-acetylmuramoyl-L-alanyl-D-glutamate--2,6-diaminopimelate ligase
VFGCGGDRDRGKRPMMGKIAAELADRAIVTDDNPRSEVPATIRAAVIEADARLIEVAGRQKAIATAIADLQKDDILIIAGKGHEQGQTIGDQVLPFDDASVAREILKR